MLDLYCFGKIDIYMMGNRSQTNARKADRPALDIFESICLMIGSFAAVMPYRELRRIVCFVAALKSVKTWVGVIRL